MKSYCVMQLELNNIGYDNSYLETLSNEVIKSMYIDEFGKDMLVENELEIVLSSETITHLMCLVHNVYIDLKNDNKVNPDILDCVSHKLAIIADKLKEKGE